MRKDYRSPRTEERIKKKIVRFVNKTQLVFFDVYKINWEELFTELHRSKLYAVMFGGDTDRAVDKNSFIRNLFDYKDRNPEFGFLSRKDAREFINDPTAADITAEMAGIISLVRFERLSDKDYYH